MNEVSAVASSSFPLSPTEQAWFAAAGGAPDAPGPDAPGPGAPDDDGPNVMPLKLLALFVFAGVFALFALVSFQWFTCLMTLACIVGLALGNNALRVLWIGSSVFNIIYGIGVFLYASGTTSVVGGEVAALLVIVNTITMLASGAIALCLVQPDVRRWMVRRALGI